MPTDDRPAPDAVFINEYAAFDPKALDRAVIAREARYRDLPFSKIVIVTTEPVENSWVYRLFMGER